MIKSLCCILNYNVNKNADYLYKNFSKYLPTCVLDSNSISPYSYFENVGNFYYTGLFNHAIKKFKSENYKNLLYITSDVRINQNVIEYLSQIANSDLNDIGIYNLQSDKNSKDYFNHWNNIPAQRNIDNTYDTNICEGFCNLLHHDVAILHDEIPLLVNRFGVCINEYTAEITKLLKKKIIVDCNYTIFHPDIKGYDYNLAHSYDEIFREWYKDSLLKIKKTLNR